MLNQILKFDFNSKWFFEFIAFYYIHPRHHINIIKVK
jgi:hypothetical protein